VPTAPPSTCVIWYKSGVTSAKDDQPGEIAASSKSSMNASAMEVVRMRVPVPAQTPVVGMPPLLELVVPLVLVLVLPLVLLPLPLLVVVPPPAPPPPLPFGLAVPDEHAEASAKAV